MATRYLILRSNVDRQRGDVTTESTGRSRGTRQQADADLSVETYDGHETDVGKLREDPKNHAVLDADIVLSLVKPKSIKAADTAALKLAGGLRFAPGIIAVNAHTSPFTGQGVTVAVLDTGIDAGHPAFAGKTLVTKNFTTESAENDVNDLNGHGTHCAGTICGAPVGDIRVGVAPGVAKLCVGKVLAAAGGTAEMMISGMIWAVREQKAAVVSMSLGYDLPGNTERLVERGLSVTQASNLVLRQHADLLRTLATLQPFLRSQSSNVVFVAATGNESERPGLVLDAGLPAAQLFAVGAVGATPAGDRWAIAPFSNGRAEVVAPGVDVVSAAPGGGWATMSGTSMATPHAAGVAALWVERARTEGLLALPDWVSSAIKSNAVRKPLADVDVNAIGAGMIQAPQS